MQDNAGTYLGSPMDMLGSISIRVSRFPITDLYVSLESFGISTFPVIKLIKSLRGPPLMETRFTQNSNTNPTIARGVRIRLSNFCIKMEIKRIHLYLKILNSCSNSSGLSIKPCFCSSGDHKRRTRSNKLAFSGFKAR
uniref:Uncharacterized protein n=1 Tax=Opuntia streptacantha TaxID=393608 RepID=A0A7C9EJY7_OPUST